MAHYTFLLIPLLTISLISGQTSNDEDYLLKLRFVLREEKIPAIINYLLNNSLTEHDITTQDIIKLSKIEQFTLNDTIKSLKDFNKSLEEAFSVDSLEHILTALHIEFSDFCPLVLNKLQIRDEIPILEALEINVGKFLQAAFRHQYIYDILREGKYDDEHVETALDINQNTREEVFAAAKTVILDTIRNGMNSTALMEVLRENGWNRERGQDIWEALGITTEDVYAVDKFRQIFENITTRLNQNLSLAVPIAPNELAIHKNIYDEFSENVDGITVKIMADTAEVNVHYHRKLGPQILAMTINTRFQKFLAITENYTSLENCTYVTITGGKAVAEEMELVEFLVGKKREGLVFNQGSPLICENHLYGLASEESNESIIFDRFYTSDENDDDFGHDYSSAGCASHLFMGVLWAFIALIL